MCLKMGQHLWKKKKEKGKEFTHEGSDGNTKYWLVTHKSFKPKKNLN